LEESVKKQKFEEKRGHKMEKRKNKENAREGDEK
jgi:hypothetical protein